MITVANAKEITGDNTLVALTLMIAESKPEDKDIMVKVLINLINNTSSIVSKLWHFAKPLETMA